VHGKEHVEEIVSIRHKASCARGKNLGSPGQGGADEAIFWQEGSVPAGTEEKTLTGSRARLRRAAAQILSQPRLTRSRGAPPCAFTQNRKWRMKAPIS
jgi:hypothetical protein